MSKNRVIGLNNAMPWSLKEDMARFKKLTMGWPCIMGRKTWESLSKKPLPGRLNIVVSSTMKADNLPQNQSLSSGTIKGCETSVKIFPSLSSAVEHCAAYEKVFICGGETIYKQALALADKIELTIIHDHYEGDTYFPEIDPAYWTQVNTGDFDTFSFITYTKVK